MRKILVLALFALIAAAPAGAQISCNLFELSAGVNGETLSVSLSTDLPDSTRLAVEVNRRYWRKGRSGVFSLDYFATELSVAEVKAGLKLDVSKAAFDKAMAKVNMAAEFAGRGPVVVKELDGRFKVKVMTTMNQPDKAFGDFNRKLEGQAVVQDNEYRGARRIRWVNADGKEEQSVKTAPKAVRVKARDFQAGKLYVLRRKVDLLCHPEPHALAARTVPIMAPQAAIVYIDRRVEGGDWVWFRVAVAIAPDRAPMAFGWARHDGFDIKKHRETAAPGMMEKLEATGFMTEGDAEARWRMVGEPRLEKDLLPGRLVRATVELTDGLEKTEAERQARLAAWSVLERSGAQLAVIDLQREGDTEPNAGEVWILPRKMAVPEGISDLDFSALEAGDRRVSARIDADYFKARPKALALDTKVLVKEEGSFEVILWADPLSLKGERKARIAAGSMAVIKGIRYVDTAEKIALRYQVEAENGKVGWVAEEVVRTF